MNRIVRDHYPIEKLPDDLRDGLTPTGHVRVTIEQAGGLPGSLRPETRVPARPEVVPSLEQLFRRRHTTFPTGADADAHVRALRKEWD